ncbi:ATP-binding protein [Desulfonatronum thioautotrophicum]|uniref:ATP-binding protein n=1 Tax=Desulfonatronum thioautotrophicum TaxID=617001 RepID=UPI0005EAF215|nr:ATP-binding protein [Desulfonatronum thioautotrophicum]
MGTKIPFGPRPFQPVKFLSWSSLVLILAVNLMLSVFIANSARQTMLEKNQEFAILLAENLNHQIFQRFTLPTVIGFGRIELRQPAQFERLDQIVLSTIHSFHVLEVRIYDFDHEIAYSTNHELVGKREAAGKAVRQALDPGISSFELISRVSSWWAMFTLELAPESFVLRTTYPLRAERGFDPVAGPGPIMGALEFTQDITDDYEAVLLFQILILAASFASSLLLFSVLYLFIRRAAGTIAKRADEKERLERELHQNEKLASMGRTVASIAHEIRNPLGIIRSTAELLMKRSQSRDAEADPQQTRLLKAIYDESIRLSQTVNDFLDYARPRSPNKSRVVLSQILDQVLAFWEHEMGRSQVVVLREEIEGLSVMGDKDLLYRAVYNVLANALQAMNGPGTIRISTQKDAAHVTLSIHDSGPGIPPQLTDKIQDPFFTTKEKGTGLGLSIVSSILRSHNAHLELTNHPQGGAVVRMVFPANED